MGNSDTITWVEIREFLIDWIEKRDREKLTEKALDDITGKLDKIKKYFDDNTDASRDELSKKSKEDLIEYIASAEWYHASKQRAIRMSQDNSLPVPGMHLSPS